MSGFSADWLRLREPFDARARAGGLVDELRGHVAAAEPPLEIVDLGAGAGANLRYLAPRLGGRQHWRLVDDDAALLDDARRATRAWADARGARVTQTAATLELDAADLRCLVSFERCNLAAEIDTLALPPGALVTASALLDLVSAAWLETLARRCRAAQAAVCFALTYDGTMGCIPAEPNDAAALALFNRHQRGDKGFGPALGPDAARFAERCFAGADYDVTVAQSPWRVSAHDAALQSALLDGWHAAALEIAPARRAALDGWHAVRSGHVVAGRAQLTVGHVDLVGRPPRRA